MADGKSRGDIEFECCAGVSRQASRRPICQARRPANQRCQVSRFEGFLIFTLREKTDRIGVTCFMNSDALAARIGNLLGSKTPGSASGAAAESLSPPVIPNHELIAQIGGGSYGEVWLARSVTGALRAV